MASGKTWTVNAVGSNAYAKHPVYMYPHLTIYPRFFLFRLLQECSGVVRVCEMTATRWKLMYSN